MKSISLCLAVVTTVCTTAAVSQLSAGDHGRHHNNNHAGMNVRGHDNMMMRADKLDNPDFFKKSDSVTARDSGRGTSKGTNVNFVKDTSPKSTLAVPAAVPPNVPHPIPAGLPERHVPIATIRQQITPTTTAPVPAVLLLPGLESMPIRNFAGLGSPLKPFSSSSSSSTSAVSTGK